MGLAVPDIRIDGRAVRLLACGGPDIRIDGRSSLVASIIWNRYLFQSKRADSGTMRAALLLGRLEVRRHGR